MPIADEISAGPMRFLVHVPEAFDGALIMMSILICMERFCIDVHSRPWNRARKSAMRWGARGA